MSGTTRKLEGCGRTVLKPGTKVEGFTVSGTVSEKGGFGILYKAKHPLHKEVALKEYFPEDLARRSADGDVAPKSENVSKEFEDNKEKLLVEAKALGSISNNPNVVQVLHYMPVRGTAYIAMQYIDGTDLEQKLNEGIFDLDVSSLAKGLLNGLSAIHEIGLLHLDLKPENIIVRPGDNTPVIVDFGSVQKMKDAIVKEDIPFSGTDDYAAPERYEDGSQLDERSDLYSLGKILHRCMAKGEPPSGPDKGNEKLAGLIKRLQADEPEDRPNDCQKALAELDGSLQKEVKNGVELGSVGRPIGGASKKTESFSLLRKLPLAPAMVGISIGVFVIILGVPALMSNRDNESPKALAESQKAPEGNDLPMLVINADPAGASIEMLAHDIDFVEGSARVSPGTYVVEARKAGYRTEQRKVVIAEGSDREVLNFKLRKLEAGDHFRDPGRSELLSNGPLMIVIPRANYRMGFVYGVGTRHQSVSPAHWVRFKKPFSLSKSEITVGQFRKFAEATNYQSSVTRSVQEGGADCEAMGVTGNALTHEDWKQPGFDQSSSHPVTCVSYLDARAFVNWLSEQTGQNYRLPSEAEWEFGARAFTGMGIKTAHRYYFGPEPSQLCKHGNVGGTDALLTRFVGGTADCADGYTYTSPINSFRTNPHGLNDVIGNVSEWTEDCFNPDYGGAPESGSALLSGDCTKRMIRGGSWEAGAKALQYQELNVRQSALVDASRNTYGFRVARDIAGL